MSEAQVFYNFVLFDGVTPQVRSDGWLEVIDGHIRQIEYGPRPQPERGIDLAGRVVIPGLIDAHVHLMTFFSPQMNPAVLLSLNRQIRLNLANCIRCGVTTVRDMAAAPGFMRRILRWIEKGKAIGPRIVRTNSFIIPPGAMPEFVPTFPPPVRFFWGGQIAERVSTPGEVRGAVRRMVALGADWIKTTHSDKSIWLNRPDPPVFGRFFEEIENLMEVGLSAFEALRSATAGNARILGMEDKLGTIEPGKQADFVVLDGNPLTDISALRQVRMVVKEGKIVYSDRT